MVLDVTLMDGRSARVLKHTQYLLEWGSHLDVNESSQDVSEMEGSVGEDESVKLPFLVATDDSDIRKFATRQDTACLY